MVCHRGASGDVLEGVDIVCAMHLGIGLWGGIQMIGGTSQMIRAILRKVPSRRRDLGGSMSALSRDIGARSSVSQVERAVHYQSGLFTVHESHDSNVEGDAVPVDTRRYR